MPQIPPQVSPQIGDSAVGNAAVPLGGGSTTRVDSVVPTISLDDEEEEEDDDEEEEEEAADIEEVDTDDEFQRPKSGVRALGPQRPRQSPSPNIVEATQPPISSTSSSIAGKKRVLDTTDDLYEESYDVLFNKIIINLEPFLVSAND